MTCVTPSVTSGATVVLAVIVTDSCGDYREACSDHCSLTGDDWTCSYCDEGLLCEAAPVLGVSCADGEASVPLLVDVVCACDHEWCAWGSPLEVRVTVYDVADTVTGVAVVAVWVPGLDVVFGDVAVPDVTVVCSYVWAEVGPVSGLPDDFGTDVVAEVVTEESTLCSAVDAIVEVARAVSLGDKVVAVWSEVCM